MERFSSSGGLVTESRDSTSVTYLINEKSLFFSNGLKMLQKNYKSGFVKCSKGMMNGRVKLTYDVSKYVSIADYTELNNRNYLTVTCNLLQTAIDLREIGFLQRENISLEPRDIFVDRETCKTCLIYLPLNIQPAPNSHIVFEKEIRETLVKFAHDKHIVTSAFVVEICQDLMNIKVNMQAIISKIQTQELQTAGNSDDSKTGSVHRTTNRTKIFGTEPSKDKFGDSESADELSPKTSAAEQVYRNTLHKSYDKTGTERRKKQNQSGKQQDSPKKRANNKPVGTILLFFLIYIAALISVMLVVFNYYSNSGMTIGFLALLLCSFLFAFMAPVFFFSKKGKDKDTKPSYAYGELQLNNIPVKLIDDFIPPIVLNSVGNAVKLEFFINKKEFVIGKIHGMADGVIPFDKTIGDVHCKVVWNEKFFIKDLDSEYGTFVNDVRVVPGQAFPIKTGDKITISKYNFEVK